MTVVIDDHLLLDVLAKRAHPDVAEEAARGRLFTTGCWYYRLARAAARAAGGSSSSHLADLRRGEQEQVRGALEDLPFQIGLVEWRTLVPVMAALRLRRAPNMLNAEALAVAVLASADIVVHVDSPLLREEARDLAVSYRFLH